MGHTPRHSSIPGASALNRVLFKAEKKFRQGATAARISIRDRKRVESTLFTGRYKVPVSDFFIAQGQTLGHHFVVITTATKEQSLALRDRVKANLRGGGGGVI